MQLLNKSRKFLNSIQLHLVGPVNCCFFNTYNQGDLVGNHYIDLFSYCKIASELRSKFDWFNFCMYERVRSSERKYCFKNTYKEHPHQLLYYVLYTQILIYSHWQNATAKAYLHAVVLCKNLFFYQGQENRDWFGKLKNFFF